MAHNQRKQEGIDSDEYMKLFTRKSGIVSALAAQQVYHQLAMKLLAIRLITEDVQKKADIPDKTNEYKIKTLLDAVIDTVKKDPNQYKTFIDVLKGFPGLVHTVKFIDKPLEVPPRVRIIPEPHDSTITLTCDKIPSDDTFPILTYKWADASRPDETLSTDATYDALDVGTYCCTARNEFGPTTVDIKIEQSPVQTDYGEIDSTEAKYELRVAIPKPDKPAGPPVPQPYHVAITTRKPKSVTVTWKQHEVKTGQPKITDYMVQYKAIHDNWPQTDPSDVQGDVDGWKHVKAEPDHEQCRKADIVDLYSNQPYDIRVYAKNADDRWSEPCNPRTNVTTSKTFSQWIKDNPKEFITIILGIITIVLLAIGLIVSIIL